MRTTKIAAVLMIVAAAAICTPEIADAENLRAAPSDDVAGKPLVYVTQGGWGELQLSEASENGALRFKLESSSSGSGCSMSGTAARNLQDAQVDPLAGADPCTLTMKRTARGIELDSTTPEACAAYCGNNGALKGLYLSANPVCAPENIQSTLARAAEAEDAPVSIKSLINQCTDTLTYSSVAALRLELAAAYDRKGDQANCLSALSPYVTDVARSDEEIVQGMTGTAAEEITTIIGTVRSMMNGCERQSRR